MVKIPTIAKPHPIAAERPSPVNAGPGDIVKLDSGIYMLVHSTLGTPRWPLTGWRVVACTELRHRADYTLGTLRRLSAQGAWKVRSLELIHGRAVELVQRASASTVAAIVRHAGHCYRAGQWETGHTPPPRQLR